MGTMGVVGNGECGDNTFWCGLWNGQKRTLMMTESLAHLEPLNWPHVKTNERHLGVLALGMSSDCGR